MHASPTALAACDNIRPDLEADITTYAGEVARFLNGELPAAVLKAKRVPRGVYEQRRDGSYMLRVRVSGGVLTAGQTAELARLSQAFSSGSLHVTTRQDVQFHDLDIADTPTVMRRLLDVGLTSKGGGGNTVRNIMACPLAGICPAESFDVTPCAHAVTDYLLRLVGSGNLPRKFKIAFSGCAADCALAQVADVGFLAAIRDGQPGFRVTVGGGMGAKPRVADTLADWMPAGSIIRVAESVRRLFDQLGDRSDRQRARLRFVLEKEGLDRFRERFHAELASVTAEGVPDWTGSGDAARRAPAPAPTPGPPDPVTMHGLRVIPQRQADFVTVPLHLPLGFLSAADFARVGEISARYSEEGGVRTTREQRLLIRFVAPERLPALADELRTLETDVLSPVALDRFVACAGASTCRLGICLARQAARACASALDEAGIARATLDALRFNINGCSNACGQHPVGAIGFFGTTRRVAGRLTPFYGLTLGGRCTAAGARFGHPAGTLPASALPDFAVALATDFESGRRDGESFLDYADRRGTAVVAAMAARHATLPPFDEHPEAYRDLGTDEPFSLAGRGAGECGAGVFEVIRNDLQAARQAADPFSSLVPAARALLITRGIDAQDPDTVLREFERLFLDNGLVDTDYRPLLTRGRAYSLGWCSALDGQDEPIARLRKEVEGLFATLDANLEFHPPAAGDAAPAPPTTTCDTLNELDLRGVNCPLNFVKAKLRLEPMPLGGRLAIALDDGDPIRNVPASFVSEGQTVETSTRLDDGHWRVIVRKTK